MSRQQSDAEVPRELPRFASTPAAASEEQSRHQRPRGSPLRDSAHYVGGGCLERQRFAPLFRDRSSAKPASPLAVGTDGVRRTAAWRLRRIIGDVFFIRHVHLAHFATYLVSYHFVPPMMALVALTVNLLLHVVMGLVFPVVADGYTSFINAAVWREYADPDRTAAITHAEAHAAAHASSWLDFYGHLILPHLKAMLAAGLVFVGGATIGYKLMTVVGDCGIDSCRLVVHPGTGVELHCFQLFQQLHRIARSGRFALALFALILLAEGAVTAAVCFTPYFGIEWQSRDRNVFYVVVATIAGQAVWTAAAAVRLWRRDGGLTEDGVARWWGWRLPVIQRAGVAVVLGVGLVFAVESGFPYGATCVAEGLVYLNFAHIAVAGGARATLFVLRLLESVRVVATDKLARYAAVVFALPLLVVLVVNYIMIDSLVASSLQIPPLALLIDALCQHTHEHRAELEEASRVAAKRRKELRDSMMGSPPRSRAAAGPANNSVSGSSSVVAAQLAEAEIPLLRTVLSVGTAAVLLSQTNAFRHEVHYSPRNAMRAGLRMLVALFMVATLAVCLWTSLQFSPVFAAKEGTECVELAPGRIRVKASVIEAELYAVDPDVDPNALLYEPSPHLYDRRRYAGICERRWDGGLHAGDLAYFSTLTYLDPMAPDFEVMLRFFNANRRGGARWSVVDKGDVLAKADAISRSAVDPLGAVGVAGGGWSEHVDRAVRATFHHLEMRSADGAVATNVIAIRGTDPRFARDFLQNVLIFSEVFLFQAMSLIVPGAGLLPESIVKDLIRVGSMMDVSILDFDTRRRQHHYFEDVEAYVRAFQLVHRTERAQRATGGAGDVGAVDPPMVLTGHSLGGVVAQIVGSRLRVPAVAFSAPGVALLERKFGIEPHAIDAYITNVICSNDFIPTIGKLGGCVNHIQCEHRRAEVCHSIELQTIRLWTMCPDYRAVVAVNGTYSVVPQPHHRLLSRLSALLGK